ncbi:SPX domain-containing protein [Xylariaceae sp. FL0804]|nr:SPX domain-containing protein [Xylariaceae sp. FL0804]
MKFAQEFRKTLQREGFPQRWIELAIPYGQLKKCLKKVINELRELGLDRDTLAELSQSQNETAGAPSLADLGFHYHLDGRGADPNHFRPRLTVSVSLRDGVAVDAKLSPSSRDFLRGVALKLATDATSPLAASDDETPPPPPPLAAESAETAEIADVATDAPAGAVVGLGSDDEDTSSEEQQSAVVKDVEVPLVFDGEFFDMLQTDVSNLDTLQEEEQEKLKQQIIYLGNEVKTATKPSSGRRARGDLETWRKIFELYLDARIFFSNRETDHGARPSTQAHVQLQWFQHQVVSRKLEHGLKLPSSRQAFGRFVAMNTVLLRILKFQEINSLAVTKILKKFDKRTSLHASKIFPTAVHSAQLLAGNVARDACAEMSSELITVVPRLDDYLCPICFVVAYWPIKLHCDHIFCSRCLVKMCRKGERFCPLCRADTVMRASVDNIDADHAAFLREYFPKEVKEKIKASERERNQEIFGPGHSDTPCSVM